VSGFGRILRLPLTGGIDLERGTAAWYARAAHQDITTGRTWWAAPQGVRGVFPRLDDRSLSLNDYTPVSVVNPLDGQVFTLYNLLPAKFGLPPDQVDVSSTDSSKRRNTYNGLEAGFSARFNGGGTAFGGGSMERTIDVTCDSTFDPNTFRFCDQSAYGMPWRHEFKLAGAPFA
jgi:hypothetical protein